MKKLLFIGILSFLGVVVDTQSASAATTVTCYTTCTPTYTSYVGTVIMDLQCNATSPASYTGKLTVNGVSTPVQTKVCTPPPPPPSTCTPSCPITCGGGGESNGCRGTCAARAACSTSPSPTNSPPTTPVVTVDAPSKSVGQTFTFSAVSTDPDGDTISYFFDYIDNNGTDWKGRHADYWTSKKNPSGVPETMNNSWPTPGTYEVRAIALAYNNTTAGGESAWSSPVTVTVTESSSCGTLNGTTQATLDQWTRGLCSVGGANNFAFSGSQWTWGCGGGNSGVGASVCSASSPASISLTFTGSPLAVRLGNAVFLEWNAPGATSCWASASAVQSNWNGWMYEFDVSQVKRGWAWGTVPSVLPLTYYLECWNARGVSSGKKSVTVEPIANGACGLVNNTNQYSLTSSTPLLCGPGRVTNFGTVEGLNWWTWGCDSVNGGWGVNNCFAMMIPPTLTFRADKYAVAPGGSADLTWSTTDAQSCRATGTGWVNGETSLGAQWNTGPLVETKTYALECFAEPNFTGLSTGLQTVTVSVCPGVPDRVVTGDKAPNSSNWIWNWQRPWIPPVKIDYFNVNGGGGIGDQALYTNNSDFSRAVVHRGLLLSGQSGLLRFTYKQLKSNLIGSYSHEIQSNSWFGAICPVDISLAGQCGPANGIQSSSTPSGANNLCTWGIPTVVASGTEWTWSCRGTPAGLVNDAVCSAPKSASSPTLSLCTESGLTPIATAPATTVPSTIPRGNLALNGSENLKAFYDNDPSDCAAGTGTDVTHDPATQWTEEPGNNAFSLSVNGVWEKVTAGDTSGASEQITLQYASDTIKINYHTPDLNAACIPNCSNAKDFCNGTIYDASNCGAKNCTGTRSCDWREASP